MKHSMIIGVSGGSCSGKTRLGNALARTLGADTCAVMLQDDYYHSQPDAQRDNLKFNFDHPQAIDFELLAQDLAKLKRGEIVHSPHYDFASHTRIAGREKPIAPKPIVLLDGILILTDPGVREVIDYAVYIRCPRDQRLARRLRRDVAERGRAPDNVVAQFDSQVEPMHQRFVAPSAVHADAVFDQAAIDADSALSEILARCTDLPDV
ncbi:MAG: uridine kinase [Pseudomonadota bacterium]